MDTFRNLAFLVSAVAGVIFILAAIGGVFVDHRDIKVITSYLGLMGLGCFLVLLYIANKRKMLG